MNDTLKKELWKCISDDFMNDAVMKMIQRITL